MSDERLDSLKINEPVEKYNSSVRIEKIRFFNYKFFHGEFDLSVNGENLLVYGENGSGKSSVYKALELLAEKSFAGFEKSINIFAQDDEVQVEFAFNNGQELIISPDLEEMPDHVDFISGLSIFKPMLDYKKLLSVHYAPTMNQDRINLYYMFRKLLDNYPVEQGGKKTILAEIEDLTEYFRLLESILETDFLKTINKYLEIYFKTDFNIDRFEYKTKIDKNTGTVTPVINLILDYQEYSIEKYHTFLNEARLSALAISIYMVAIKRLIDVLETDSLKILVLDDLLISLDMGNRLKLLEILKNEFSDFQIFFFTHDRELYELYKDKLDWKKYEFYLDENDEIPGVILKQGRSEIERAKAFYAQKDYDACALLLRKGFEKIIKNYLTQKEQRNKNCEELNLSGLIGKAISKVENEAKTILQELNSDRQHILNPLCHIDTRNIHSEELKNVISDLERLKELFK
jgi:energy-coupling factor transporter ATP-binding protein EcfA2